jgi:hypothetical protein
MLPPYAILKDLSLEDVENWVEENRDKIKRRSLPRQKGSTMENRNHLRLQPDEIANELRERP